MSATGSKPSDPFNSRGRAVHELSGWRWWLFQPLFGLLWLYYRSWRLRVEPTEEAAVRSAGPGRIVVLMHNRSLVAPMVFLRLFTPASFACLISPSKAAAWEVALFRKFGFQVIRGSTTRRSVQAGLEILRSLKAGNDVVLSPDGPSGPLYAFQRGALALARAANAPVVLLTANARASLRLPTWDRHLAPLPFASLHLRARVVEAGDPLWRLPDTGAAQKLRRLILELTEDPFTVHGHEQTGMD